jgi:hypothetical protein
MRSDYQPHCNYNYTSIMSNSSPLKDAADAAEAELKQAYHKFTTSSERPYFHLTRLPICMTLRNRWLEVRPRTFRFRLVDSAEICEFNRIQPTLRGSKPKPAKISNLIRVKTYPMPIPFFSPIRRMMGSFQVLLQTNTSSSSRLEILIKIMGLQSRSGKS